MPLLIALVLWRMFPENPSLLVIMLLSPIMVVLSYLEERRRGSRAGTKSRAAWCADLASLVDAVNAARDAYAEDLREQAPDLAELQRRARERTAKLWERRPKDDDFLMIRCGWGDRPWPIELRGAVDREPDPQLEPLQVLPSVPLTFDLREARVMGIVGDRPSVEALGRWVLLQLATLHSPEDVSMAVLVDDDGIEAWRWTSWLPHAQRSPVGSERAGALVEELVALIDSRRASGSLTSAGSVIEHPVVVAFVDHRNRISPPQMARLLREGPAVGVYVIWMGGRREDLPGEVRTIVELAGTEDVVVTFTTSGEQLTGAREGTQIEPCRETALALAPLIDAAPRERRIEPPRRVSLFSIWDLQEPTATAVTELWDRAPTGLSVPIGMNGEGPISLDLDRDGPHALVAGTTGSGKSELLQTIVASLAWHLSPEQVNLLLIDYKGGAAFKDCAELPHTVGLVTDLDVHLSQRALVSLDAELERRERILRDADARDVTDLERRGHARLPRLVLIVDEFATLVKELPAFVDGMIDLAQRGRSLGIHLVLATQRPAGVINDAIRANTNLRIALRVTDEPDSSDVVGTTEAAYIPRSVPGRALLRRGHGEVEPFQAAFGGTPAHPRGDRVVVRPWGMASSLKEGANGPAHTQLAAAVAAIREAASSRGLPPARSPWLPPLPSLLRLADLASPEDPFVAAFGLIDRPERQRQDAALFDLSGAGGLLVYGSAGAGKTTLLRTVAGSFAGRVRPSELHLYGIDYGAGPLRPLAALPHCGDIVNGDEHDRVERLIALLRDEIDRRRRDPSRIASTRWLVLLDGYEGFNAAFERVNMGELVDLLPRVVADGRGVGIHFAISVERKAGIPSGLAALLPTRVVLRMTDDDEFLALGLERRGVQGVALPPGRGFVDGHPVQVAVVGSDATPENQGAALARIAAETEPAPAGGGPRSVGLLPTEVSLEALRPGDRPLVANFGVAEADLSEAQADLSSGHFLIAGPYRSGRSTALLTIARSLRASTPQGRFWLLAARRSSPGHDGPWDRVMLGVDACREALDANASAPSQDPLLLFVDDADELVEGPCSAALEPLVKQRDNGLRVIAAAESVALHRSFGSWLSELRKHKQGLLLDPDLDVDGDLLGTRLPRRQKSAFPPGRGYLVSRGSIQLVQTAR
ncbi:MAG: FtsK/SpoIIIE domain-containing protein [Actinomycetota bacterium]